MSTQLIKYEAACRADKETFVALGRASFAPSQREVCRVCGRFQSLTHAHHVVPLTMQFDRGFEQPEHNHVWLCPTHHAAVHILIGQAMAKQKKASGACINLVCDLQPEEFRKVLEVAEGALA